MISTAQWASLLTLQRSQFRYPDKMQWSVVSALDQLANRIGSRPQVLDDYRPGDPKQHGKGLATDTYWPGVDPLNVWEHIKTSRLFSGFGIYVNEKGAVSFHTDKRIERTVTNPATWGDFIAHIYDAEDGEHKRQDNYTTAQAVLDFLKKKVRLQ